MILILYRSYLFYYIIKIANTHSQKAVIKYVMRVYMKSDLCARLDSLIYLKYPEF